MGKLEAHAKEDAPFKHTSGEPILMVWTEREDSLQTFANCCLHISHVSVILILSSVNAAMRLINSLKIL